MIAQYEKIDAGKWKEDFLKKFQNLIKKAPIIAQITMLENSVKIKEFKSEKNYEFTFDYSLPIKIFIHNLVEIFEQEVYPVIILKKITFEKCTPEEVEKLIEEGMSVDEALSYKKEIIDSIRYRIYKTIINHDEIFIKNELTKERSRYKFPSGTVSLFFKKLRAGISEEEAGKYFFDNAQYLNRIYPENIWNEMNKAGSVINFEGSVNE